MDKQKQKKNPLKTIIFVVGNVYLSIGLIFAILMMGGFFHIWYVPCVFIIIGCSLLIIIFSTDKPQLNTNGNAIPPTSKEEGILANFI